MPHSSAMRARFGALRLAWSQPVRIFKVTGSFTAFAVASRMRPAWTSSRIREEPAWPLTTFFTGQPKLMSMSAAPRSSLSFAASAITSGSQPASWTAIGNSSGEFCAINMVWREFADHRLAGDHLRHDEAGAGLLHETAKRHIRHPRHGGENDRRFKLNGPNLNAHNLGSLDICSGIGRDNGLAGRAWQGKSQAGQAGQAVNLKGYPGQT